MSEKNLPAPLFAPRTFQEAREFAEFIAKTNFVPKDYRDKPDEILACITYGSEVGLSAMQSLNSISVINGRPSLWGDSSLALVQASGLLEYIKETDDGDTAICEVKRKGDPEPRVTRWSKADTERAGLANKENHRLYPARMRQMRTRGFCLRDKFADVLRGLISEDEAIDITPPKGELTEAETPRRVKLEHDLPREARTMNENPNPHGSATAPDHIDIEADGLKEDAKEEGASLEPDFYHQPGASVADGDYPTSEAVRQAFVNSPFPPAEKFARIELAVPDFKSKGYAKLDGPERRDVLHMLALSQAEFKALLEKRRRDERPQSV